MGDADLPGVPVLEPPSVQIDNLMLVRVMFQIVRGDPAEDEVRWRINGARHPRVKNSISLTGDFTMVQEGRVGAFTAICGLRFRSEAGLEKLVKRHGVDGIVAAYGPWASHVLWDFGSQSLRAAAANSSIGFKVPFLTPDLHKPT